MKALETSVKRKMRTLKDYSRTWCRQQNSRQATRTTETEANRAEGWEKEKLGERYSEMR